MKLDGRITILGDDTRVIIEIEDDASGELLARVDLSPEKFCQSAMGRLALNTCTVETGELSRVGKELVVDDHIFVMPDSDYKDRDKIAAKLAKETCPEGWVASTYFGSQNSYFKKDGITYARANIRTWK